MTLGALPLVFPWIEARLQFYIDVGNGQIALQIKEGSEALTNKSEGLGDQIL